MNAATLAYIRRHAGDDVRKLALSRVPEDVDLRAALTQIEGRQLAARKLPAFAATDGLLFPQRLSLEQCSSEATARYKRSIAERLVGHLPKPSLCDLTGGFGVDFSMLAPLFYRAVYVEKNAALCDLARHNLPLLGCNHALVCCAEAAEFLASCHAPSGIASTPPRHSPSIHESVPGDMPYSLIFIDPARRDAGGRRVALISDCTPDLLTLAQQLRAAAAFILIKLSPMLDLTATLRALPAIAEAHVVSVAGECRELLLVMQGNPSDPLAPLAPSASLAPSAPSAPSDVPIHCIDLPTHSPSALQERVLGAASAFTLASERSTPATLLQGSLQAYLYEPNASLLKAGAFNTICRRYPVLKLAPDTHLYTADSLIPDFPGRRWRILDTASFQKKELRRLLAGIHVADLTVRGFPMSVSTLRSQLRLREGGTTHFIATTLADHTRCLIQVQRI